VGSDAIAWGSGTPMTCTHVLNRDVGECKVRWTCRDGVLCRQIRKVEGPRLIQIITVGEKK